MDLWVTKWYSRNLGRVFVTVNIFKVDWSFIVIDCLDMT